MQDVPPEEHGKIFEHLDLEVWSRCMVIIGSVFSGLHICHVDRKESCLSKLIEQETLRVAQNAALYFCSLVQK